MQDFLYSLGNVSIFLIAKLTKKKPPKFIDEVTIQDLRIFEGQTLNVKASFAKRLYL